MIDTGKCRGDAPELAPTIMAAVPLIMDKIRAGVTKKVGASAVLSKLFGAAYAAKASHPLPRRCRVSLLKRRVAACRLDASMSTGDAASCSSRVLSKASSGGAASGTAHAGPASVADPGGTRGMGSSSRRRKAKPTHCKSRHPVKVNYEEEHATGSDGSIGKSWLSMI